jgi:hypothetical protein
LELRKTRRREALRHTRRGTSSDRAAQTQWLDRRRDVRAGRDLRDQLLDLALGAKASAGEHVGVIFRGEMRSQQQDAGEVDRRIREHVEEDGKVPNRAGRLHAALRFVFAHAQLVDAVLVERSARHLAICAAGVDLREVRQDVSGEGVAATDERLEVAQQRGVVDGIEGRSGQRAGEVFQARMLSPNVEVFHAPVMSPKLEVFHARNVITGDRAPRRWTETRFHVGGRRRASSEARSLV